MRTQLLLLSLGLSAALGGPASAQHAPLTAAGTSDGVAVTNSGTVTAIGSAAGTGSVRDVGSTRVNGPHRRGMPTTLSQSKAGTSGSTQIR